MEKSMVPTEGAELVGTSPQARQISVEQAADEIMKTFGRKKRFYYSDIMEQLNLDLETVVEACTRLEREGHIEFESE